MEYTQEDVDRMVASIQPSIDVIDQVIANSERYAYATEEEKADAVDRNYRHIEVVLGKEEVAAQIEDATPYTDAIARAKAYLNI